MEHLTNLAENLSREVRELSLGTGGEIERLQGAPSPLRFLRDFVLPNKPCIITHAIDHWPALAAWSNAYLRTALANQQVSVHFTPDGFADALVDLNRISSVFGCIIKPCHAQSPQAGPHQPQLSHDLSAVADAGDDGMNCGLEANSVGPSPTSRPQLNGNMDANASIDSVECRFAKVVESRLENHNDFQSPAANHPSKHRSNSHVNNAAWHTKKNNVACVCTCGQGMPHNNCGLSGMAAYVCNCGETAFQLENRKVTHSRAVSHTEYGSAMKVSHDQPDMEQKASGADDVCNAQAALNDSQLELPNNSGSGRNPLRESKHPISWSRKSREEKLQHTWFVTAHVERLPFSTALDLILQSEIGNGVAYAQEQNGCFLSEYSPLAVDAETHLPWATEAFGCLPEAVNLWIGNEKAVTSFHKDHFENLYAVIAGEKHFTLLPPTDVHRMYIQKCPSAQYVKNKGRFTVQQQSPVQFVPWVSVNPYPPPELISEATAQFPHYFNGPRPFTCTLKAGEILYLPSMWFHHVRQSPDLEGRTIALNFWYDMQFDVKYAYFNFLESLMLSS